MAGRRGSDDYGAQDFFNRKRGMETKVQKRNTEVGSIQGMEKKGEFEDRAIRGGGRYGVNNMESLYFGGHAQTFGCPQFGQAQSGHRQSGFAQFGHPHFGHPHFGSEQFGAAHFEGGHFETGGRFNGQLAGGGLMRGLERPGFGNGTGFDLEIMILCLNIGFVGHNYGGYGDSFNSGLQNTGLETGERGEFFWH